jgi:hypothetical protein
MNTNDFLARLRAGEPADAIAADISAALNTAEAEYLAEQKAAEAAANHKRELLVNLRDALHAYVRECEPELAELFGSADDEKSLDALERAFKETVKTWKLFAPILHAAEKSDLSTPVDADAQPATLSLADIDRMVAEMFAAPTPSAEDTTDAEPDVKDENPMAARTVKLNKDAIDRLLGLIF